MILQKEIADIAAQKGVVKSTIDKDWALGHFIDAIFSIATFEEIKENEFNLNIPRYVDTFEEEEVDIVAVQVEIDKLEGELKTVQAEMSKYLKELGA